MRIFALHLTNQSLAHSSLPLISSVVGSYIVFSKSMRKQHTPRLASINKAHSDIKQETKTIVNWYTLTFRNLGLADHALQGIRPMSFALDRRYRTAHTWIVHSVYTNLRSKLNIRHILRPYLFSMVLNRPYLNDPPEE